MRELLLEAAARYDAPDSSRPVLLHLFIDGASRGNPGHSAAGIVIRDPGGVLLDEEALYLGTGTNNEAEYEALIRALEKAAAMEAKTLVVHSDSELVVRQMQVLYRVREPRLRTLYFKAVSLLENFRDVTFVHIPREKNRQADGLANRALDEYTSRQR
jgi:ribonuclease HI